MTSLTLPQQMAQMDHSRLKAYQENLDFYNGLQWSTRRRGSERQLTFNYAKVFIDKVTSYLMAGVTFSVPPADASEEARERAQRAEEVLRGVYEDGHLAQLDFDTEVDTAILGDGCFKVTWDVAERRVRVSAPDVQGIFVWHEGDDVTRVRRLASRYRLSWEEVEARYGLPLAAERGGDEASVVEVWTASEFEVWVEDEVVDSRANPYGFIPFVVFPNLREPKQFWGVSDLPPLMQPARELNRALSQLSMILELSGNPIAVLENVSEAADIAVQPGAVWEIPERAKAYLLDLLQGGGIKLHVDYVELLYRALHDLSEAPRTSFGDNPRALSGVALEMEMHPLMQKIRRKRLIRSAAYQRRNEMILRILEQRTGESFAPYRSRIQWGPVLPQDRSRLVSDERQLVAAGIHSRRLAAQTLGVENPEAEYERWLEEQGRAGGVRGQG